MFKPSKKKEVGYLLYHVRLSPSQMILLSNTIFNALQDKIKVNIYDDLWIDLTELGL